ncbi:MAG: hypothetical protein J1F61_06465 [Clostridiales bacterium]|nr:hypothetical protein [Clostridiales bacterium]
MTKLRTKLLVFLSVLICSVCLCLGITACNSGGGHEHTFGGFWLFDGADGHYRLATCHPEVKSGLEPHVDETGDFKCDVCGFVMHVHVDEEDDGVCDECQTVIHKHTFDDKWTFNEIRHWHKATCDHFIERSDYVAHSFTQGLCECGVKESEAKVYALYKNSPEYAQSALYFDQWLDWLKAEGITVEYTANGDGIYHHKDGTDEVRFLGERTVKVQAVSGGEPLSDVWFMVSLYDGKNYRELNGTIALGLAKTDESGIAEITFRPVGGYSSATVNYHIRVALAADVAKALGTKEENAKPIPNRYVVSNNKSYYAYEVSENSNADDIAATVSFTFSKGWNAYDTIELPYKRYYQDQINGEGIKEEGTIYTFTSSGDNLFDYFYFSPAKYSFKDSGSLKDSAKIEENAKQAASGIYKIYFTYQGTANVTLYYWNGQGVNMGASHRTKADGTPSDEYITSVSGGTAGEDKYTGGNFVDVVVIPKKGLRNYQFGIISDSAVNVTITVERVDDFVIPENYPITVGDNDNITLLGNGETATLMLQNVPAGDYEVTVNVINVVNDTAAKVNQSGNFSAYVTKGKEIPLWDGISKIKGIINIPENAQTLYLITYYGTDDTVLVVSVNLSLYEGTEVGLDEEISVPISGDKNIKQEIFFDESITSGFYKMELTIPGGQNLSGASWYVRVLVGDNDYSLSLPISTVAAVVISAYIDINQGDILSIFILNKNNINQKYYSEVVNGKLKLTALPAVEQDETYSTEIGGDSVYYNEYAFVALKAGNYKLSIVQTNTPEFVSELYGYKDLTTLEVTDSITGNVLKSGTAFGPKEEENCITEASVTFSVEEGGIVVLYFRNHGRSEFPLNLDFVIEYVD